MSLLLASILGKVVVELRRRELLDLTPGATDVALTASLVDALPDAPQFTQFSGWLSGMLIRSPMVEDLYATDDEIAEILKELEP